MLTLLFSDIESAICQDGVCKHELAMGEVAQSLLSIPVENITTR